MNPFLHNPAAGNRTPVRAEQPGVKTSSSGVATLRLYDPIDPDGGDWGISAKEFTAALDGLPDGIQEIQLLINSPGGVVSEGVAIMNALRAHPARVVAVVEGIAASSASFIAVSADELQMMENSELFIHKAWGLGLGNADDFSSLSTDLTHTDQNLASIYAGKAGGSTDDWLGAMATETWYSADEAVSAGLADLLVSTPAGKNPARATTNRFDLSIFNHAGRSAAPDPFMPTESPSQSPAAASAVGSKETHPKEGSAIVAFSDESTATLRQKLGVADDADEGTILAAIDEAMSERAEPQNKTPELPEGVVTIDEAVLNELRSNAKAGQEARAQQERESRENIVDSAVRDGRIAPARRDSWLNRLKADPEEAATLNSLEKGLSVPTIEIGFGSNADHESQPINDAEADALASLLPGTRKEAFLNG